MVATQQGGGRSDSPARRRLSPHQRRQAIWTAARDVVLSDGLQNLTHRSVAGRLRVTHALVVHYEPDIEALRVRVCAALLTEEFGQTRDRLAMHESAVSQLAELVRLLSRTGREDLAGVWLDAWSLGRRSPVLAGTVRGLMDSWQALVTGIVAAGRARDEFEISDPEACAWELIALLDGLNAHTMVSYGDPADYRFRIAALLEARLKLPPGTLNTSAPSSTTPSGAPPPHSEVDPQETS